MIVLNLVPIGLAITLEPIPLTAFILVPRRSSRAPAPRPAEGWLLFCSTAVVKLSGPAHELAFTVGTNDSFLRRGGRRTVVVK